MVFGGKGVPKRKLPTGAAPNLMLLKLKYGLLEAYRDVRFYPRISIMKIAGR
jgi:hypothetical protein